MRPYHRFLPLALAIVLVAPMSLATAEVSWTHQLTDGTDDVRNVLTNTNVTGMDGLDITSGSISEEGSDLNVTLTLAGAYDPDATYTMEVTCDGNDDRTYTFTYLDERFTINGPGLSGDQPEAYVSGDGTQLSWVVGKDQLSANERTEVSYVETFRLVGITPFSDTLPDGGGGGGGGGATGDAVHMLVRTEIVSIDHVRSIVQVVVDDEDARSLRAEFDSDGDQTVTQVEYDQHMELFHLTLSSWNSTDLTLDGVASNKKVMTVAFEGMVGRTDSSSPVSQVVTLDIHFPEVAKKGTHTYSGDLAGGGNAGEMWHVTPDSLYTLVIPMGWTFDESGPHINLDYVDENGRKFTMTGNQMRAEWNATMGQMLSLSITEADDIGADGEESPGFGFLLAGIAIIGGMIVASAWKRP